MPRLWIVAPVKIIEALRESPGLPLQHAIIERLWPEALDVPINPMTRSDKASRLIRRLRRHARGFGLPV